MIPGSHNDNCVLINQVSKLATTSGQYIVTYFSHFKVGHPPGKHMRSHIAPHTHSSTNTAKLPPPLENTFLIKDTVNLPHPSGKDRHSQVATPSGQHIHTYIPKFKIAPFCQMQSQGDVQQHVSPHIAKIATHVDTTFMHAF